MIYTPIFQVLICGDCIRTSIIRILIRDFHRYPYIFCASLRMVYTPIIFTDFCRRFLSIPFVPFSGYVA